MEGSLKSRLMWMLGLLLIYKFGTHIPSPGIDGAALAELFNQKASGTVFGLLNMFSGGAMEKASIFALGIAPYISASIIMQLATVISPRVERLQKEGDSGRRTLTQYTRYLTVAIAIVQAVMIAKGLTSERGAQGQPIVLQPGLNFIVMTALILTTGSIFVMWLGEQITDKGIGNGSSLIIFTGIASALFAGAGKLKTSFENDQLSGGMLVFLMLVMAAVVAAIVFMEQGQRRVPIQYAKRMVGRKVYGGQESHLPLKINPSGVIPAIFASTMMLFPATILGFLNAEWAQRFQGFLNPSSYLYNILFIAGILFFAYFYTAVSTNPNELAENLRKSGGYVPGIRPGKHTADYFNTILNRLTLAGGLYLAAVCVLPTIMISYFKVDIYFGGTSLLILVGVALDTMSQIQAYLLTQNYEGFLKQARLRGRRA